MGSSAPGDAFANAWGSTVADRVNEVDGVAFLIHNHDLSDDCMGLSVRYSLARARCLWQQLPRHYRFVVIIYDDRGQELDDAKRSEIRTGIVREPFTRVFFMTERASWPTL